MRKREKEEKEVSKKRKQKIDIEIVKDNVRTRRVAMSMYEKKGKRV